MTPTRRAVCTLVCALLASCVRPSGSAEGDIASDSEALRVCAHGSTLKGVDVSGWQGWIDWRAAASSGLKFAYTKATEGTGYRDPTFHQNWSGMKAHGIPRGAYHFFHPGISGKAQADFFLSYAPPSAGDLPPMLDWEVSDGVSGSRAAANARAFIDEIRARTGRPTIIYTSPGLWSGFGIPTSFAAEQLWVAHYLYCDTGGCCPTMPRGWSNWAFWQWDDKGRVPGMRGSIDLDVFNGDAAALLRLRGVGGGGGGGGAVCSGESAIGHGIGHGSRVKGPSSGHPPAVARPTGCGLLAPGQGLTRGESTISCDGRFTLTMQGDGNVVLYSSSIPLWATGTYNTSGSVFAMQSDGNLVLYSSSGGALWASNTNGHSGARLAIQTDGNLVVYYGSRALWSSGSGPIARVPTQCGEIKGGQGLAPGEFMPACGGCFSLVMQGDGNLVLYKLDGRALWSSRTNGKHGYTLDMQTGGNAVLYGSAGCPLWDTNTGGHSGSYMAVQDDGNLVVYTSTHRPIWASHTNICRGACNCGVPAWHPPHERPLPLDGTQDGGVSDAGTAFGDGGICACTCGDGTCAVDEFGNCDDGTNCLYGTSDGGSMDTCACICDDGTCSLDDTGACGDGTNCLDSFGTQVDGGTDGGDGGDNADCVCLCDDNSCSINELGDCSDGTNCLNPDLGGPNVDGGDSDGGTDQCLCICADGTCSVDDNGNCADQSNCLMSSGDADGGCTCDCGDGTCAFDALGDCENGANCVEGTPPDDLDGGTDADAGPVEPDDGGMVTTPPCVCNCADGTCAVDLLGNCEDGTNCTTDGGMAQCGVCRCTDGTCAIDSFGNCDDGSKCTPTSSGACQVCTCDNGTCGDSMGNCNDGSNCMSGSSQPATDGGSGATGCSVCTCSDGTCAIDPQGDCSDGTRCTTGSSKSGSSGGCATGDASTLGLLLMLGAWIRRRRA